VTIVLVIDQSRRVKVYSEGGYAQERRVEGIGWCLADRENWPETERLIRDAAAVLAKVAERNAPRREKVFDGTTRGTH